MEAWRGMFVLMVFMIMQRAGGQLVEGFYESSCPNVEDIVKKAVTAKYTETHISGPATLRLFFHDCFVEGCDASILIASANGDSERDAEANLSLRREGFDTVNKSKIAVENECPGVVSCADILALAARDVVVLTGGPTFNVELGRRDGLISQASRVAENIPDSSFNLSQLKTIFHKKNLSTTDMIALSGAHTLGVSHCRPITKRLYGSSLDPYLPKNFAKQLRMICPQNASSDTIIPMDQTPLDFDNKYYKNLTQWKGLFISDEVLFAEPESKHTVLDFANNTDSFKRAFITGMIRLGRVGVKTGIQGEIRTNCEAFNS